MLWPLKTELGRLTALWALSVDCLEPLRCLFHFPPRINVAAPLARRGRPGRLASPNWRHVHWTLGLYMYMHQFSVPITSLLKKLNTNFCWTKEVANSQTTTQIAPTRHHHTLSPAITAFASQRYQPNAIALTTSSLQYWIRPIVVAVHEHAVCLICVNCWTYDDRYQPGTTE